MSHGGAPEPLFNVLPVQVEHHPGVREVRVPPVDDAVSADESGAAAVVEARAEVAAGPVPVLEDGVAELEHGHQALHLRRDLSFRVRLLAAGGRFGESEAELAPDVAVVDEQLTLKASGALEDRVAIDPPGSGAGQPLRAAHLLARGPDLPPGRRPAEPF